jgi:hypothetical protein
MARGKKSKAMLKRYAAHAKKGLHTRKKRGGYWFYPGPDDDESSWLSPFKGKKVSTAPMVMEEEPSSFKADDASSTPSPTSDPTPAPAVEEFTEVREEKEEEAPAPAGMTGGRKRRRRKSLRRSSKKSKKRMGGKRRKSKKRASKRRK